MRQIVIYQSSTGFTKQYAKWIAERLQCEAKDIKQIKKNEISEYDRIVYGGWILALQLLFCLSPKPSQP